jgi:Rrf2 family iron-sulfur cluster assembly transcriptional regulator
MRMSTKGRFAVNALIDLGLRQSAGPVALATISARQRVSLSYLEQMFSRLRGVGVVESTRGPGGGYTLGRPAADIDVAQIVSAVDDPAEAGDAGDDGLSGKLWQRLNLALMAQMRTITLQSLIDDAHVQGAAVELRPVRPAVSPPPLVKPARSLAPNSVFALGQTFRA